MIGVRVSVSNPTITIVVSTTTMVVLILYFFSLNTASNTLNFIALGILITTSFFILKSRGGFIFLLYCFGLTFALLSGVLIEATGVFLIEIQETAQLTGAAGRNALLASFFLLLTYASYRLLFLQILPARFPTFKTAENLIARTVIAIAFAALLYMDVVLIILGSPLLMGIDRFTYMTYTTPPEYKWIYDRIHMAGLVVSLSAHKGIIRYRTSIIWFILATLTYIFSGEKFSKLFLLLFFFFLPYFIIKGRIIAIRHLMVGAAILIIFTLIIYINYTMTYGSADEIIMARLALQGQMNYALDNISSIMLPWHQISKHFFGINSNEVESNLPYLMYQVAPPNIVDLRLEHGATFTAPFPANFSYFFGPYLSPFFILITSFVTGAILALSVRAISSMNILLSIIAIKIFLLAYLAIMMGTISLFFNIKFLLIVLIIIFYFFIIYVFHRDRL